MEGKTNELEKVINELITSIEIGLLKAHINTNTPHLALERQAELGAYLSLCYGRIEILDTLEAEHFVNERVNHKSDLAVKKQWKTSKEGIRQQFWENRIKRIKTLIETLEKIYYYGKMEMQHRELK